MLNFLKGLWNFFSNPIEEIWHKILNLFAAVYGYFDRLFTTLGHDIALVWDTLTQFAASVARFVTHEVTYLIGFIRNEANAITRWTLKLIDSAISDIKNLGLWTLHQLDRLANAIDAATKALVSWIIQNIYDPLMRDIRSALSWITGTGAELWDLVSHPDKLAAWLAVYILKAWLSILRRWAVPITSYILHSARLLIPDLVSILEDVISKVL